MHPYVTDTSRQASQEDVVPEAIVGCGEAEHAGYDAEPVEDGIPVAKSDRCVSPLLDIHGELEDVGDPVVGVEFGVIAIALGDDIHHHGHNFQAEEGAHERE